MTKVKVPGGKMDVSVQIRENPATETRLSKKWLGSTGNVTCMGRGRQEDVASHR